MGKVLPMVKIGVRAFEYSAIIVDTINTLTGNTEKVSKLTLSERVKCVNSDSSRILMSVEGSESFG